MAKAQLKVTVGERTSKAPMAQIARVARRSMENIAAMVKAEDTGELVNAAISEMDKPVRVAAIKGAIKMGSTAGLRAILKNACEADEAWMAAYTLMSNGNRKFLFGYAKEAVGSIGGKAAMKALILSAKPDEKVRLSEITGDAESLAALARESGEAGAAAIMALMNLDAKAELAALVADMRNALNGQSSGIGIVESSEQLRRGMDAVAALEELGAVSELQSHVRGVCSTSEARQLRTSITDALAGL